MRPLPFNIRVHFDFFLVLIYAVDKEKAEALLPKPFIHETYGDKAIMAVAFAKANRFRPSFFPKFLGLAFNFAGFRHMAKYQQKSGKTIRGLKIIRSVSNKKMMVRGGDELTQYKFQYDPFTIKEKDNIIRIKGKSIDVAVQEIEKKEDANLPAGSVFPSWTEARKFGGPLLYTFELNNESVSITEGSRKYWQPFPVEVLHANTDFFDSPPYNDLQPVLSAAYMIKDIPYSWKKAVIEKL